MIMARLPLVKHDGNKVSVLLYTEFDDHHEHLA